jgi:ligand-binding sensor domain-containing protein/AraC-like DNA-binding protein
MTIASHFLRRFLQFSRALSVVIFSLILFPRPAAPLGQENPLRDRLVEGWNSSRGLPSDMVYCLEQTPDGYLWIGTQRGLVRSDGLRHETLLHNAVYDLCAGKDGALWICLGNELLRYQYGRFIPLCPKTGASWIPANRVFEDMKGDLWIGLSTGLLGRLRNGIFSQFQLPQNKESSSITAIREDSRGTLWVGTVAGGLFKGRDGIFSRTDIGRTPDYTVFRIREGRDGVLWVSTNIGLVRIQDDRPLILTQENGLSIGFVLDFLEDSEGNLWCSTPRGLNLLRRDESGAYRATPLTPANQILDFMFEDREKNLWISFPRFGLKCYRNVPFRTLAEESGVPSYSSAVLASRDGTVWIGDNVGCLFRMKDGRARQVLDMGYSPEAGILSMAEDSLGRLWLGTNHRGIFRVENAKAVPLHGGRPLPAIRRILADSRGRIWIGFQDGLACLRDGALKIYTVADGLPGNWVSNVLEGRDGRLWIATNGGLAVLKNGEFSPGGVETVLTGQVTMTLFEDEGGVLWAGTYGRGLIRVRNGEITSCGREQGLGSDIIYQVQDDGEGYLWLNTPAGVIKVAKSSWPDDPRRAGGGVDSIIYGKSDGVRGESGQYSTSNSIARTPDGELWFALDDGISIVQPRRIKVNKVLPAPVITRILLNYEEISPGRERAPFHGVKNVRFDFAAPSFVSPERVRLRYKLESRDSDWHVVEASGDQFVAYGNLPFGSYRFRLAACNSDHVWNPAEAVFEFSLKPYLPQTWPFKAGVSALALLVGLLAYSGLQKSLEQRRLKRRYKNSTLAPDKAEECARTLIRLFEQEKIFKSPDLSLASLSERLSVSPKDLSRIINERLNRNFWALVNFYRIEEARRKIGETKNGDQTILNIALEVGFNSLAAFNRAFKKFTGTTPSHYRQSNSR